MESYGGLVFLAQAKVAARASKPSSEGSGVLRYFRFHSQLPHPVPLAEIVRGRSAAEVVEVCSYLFSRR